MWVSGRYGCRENKWQFSRSENDFERYKKKKKKHKDMYNNNHKFKTIIHYTL